MTTFVYRSNFYIYFLPRMVSPQEGEFSLQQAATCTSDTSRYEIMRLARKSVVGILCEAGCNLLAKSLLPLTSSCLPPQKCRYGRPASLLLGVNPLLSITVEHLSYLTEVTEIWFLEYPPTVRFWPLLNYSIVLLRPNQPSGVLRGGGGVVWTNRGETFYPS